MQNIQQRRSRVVRPWQRPRFVPLWHVLALAPWRFCEPSGRCSCCCCSVRARERGGAREIELQALPRSCVGAAKGEPRLRREVGPAAFVPTWQRRGGSACATSSGRGPGRFAVAGWSGAAGGRCARGIDALARSRTAERRRNHQIAPRLNLVCARARPILQPVG